MDLASTTIEHLEKGRSRWWTFAGAKANWLLAGGLLHKFGIQWTRCIVLSGTSGASAQNLSEQQARAIIAPWYSFFNVANRGRKELLASAKAMQDLPLADAKLEDAVLADGKIMSRRDLSRVVSIAAAMRHGGADRIVKEKKNEFGEEFIARPQHAFGNFCRSQNRRRARRHPR